MKKVSLFGLALALALPLISAVRPAAAAQTAAPVSVATGDNQPSMALFLDGNIQNADQVAKQVEQQLTTDFAGAVWALDSQGGITVGHLQGNQLQPLLPTLSVVQFGSDNTYFVVHARQQGVILDGIIVRDKAGATTGFSVLDVVMLDSQGDSLSAHIEQALTWQDLNTGGTGGTGGSGGTGGTGSNPFGF